MNKPSFYSFLLVFVIICAACSPYGNLAEPEFRATLDSMVQSTLVAVQPSETQAPAATETPVPTVTETSTPEPPTSTPAPELEKVSDAVIINTYTPTSTPVAVLACLNRLKAVNVREYPDNESPRIDVLEITECTEIIETTADRLWGKNDKGWIPLEFLDIAAKLDRLPISEIKIPGR
jgi:hypothetical protein